MTLSETPKPKGPAAYFPSIEKNYGHTIEHWMTVLDGLEGKKHLEMVNFSNLNTASATVTRTRSLPITETRLSARKQMNVYPQSRGAHT